MSVIATLCSNQNKLNFNPQPLSAVDKAVTLHYWGSDPIWAVEWFICCFLFSHNEHFTTDFSVIESYATIEIFRKLNGALKNIYSIYIVSTNYFEDIYIKISKLSHYFFVYSKNILLQHNSKFYIVEVKLLFML